MVGLIPGIEGSGVVLENTFSARLELGSDENSPFLHVDSAAAQAAIRHLGLNPTLRLLRQPSNPGGGPFTARRGLPAGVVVGQPAAATAAHPTVCRALSHHSTTATPAAKRVAVIVDRGGGRGGPRGAVR